jgi:hypothetical protein
MLAFLERNAISHLGRQSIGRHLELVLSIGRDDAPICFGDGVNDRQHIIDVCRGAHRRMLILAHSRFFIPPHTD